MFSIGERAIEFAIVLLVILCGQGTNAQQEERSGKVRGTVVDTTGSAIAKAIVRVSDMAGKPVAVTETSGEGSFLISGLAPATYVLEVEIDNFETARQEVTVAAEGASEAILRITLRVATLQQTVSVTGSGTYATPDSVGAVKIEMPIMEIPISVVVVPKAVLAHQQVVALDQAIQNVTGVLIATQIEAATHHCSSGLEAQWDNRRQKNNRGQTEPPVPLDPPRGGQQTLCQEKQKPRKTHNPMDGGKER